MPDAPPLPRARTVHRQPRRRAGERPAGIAASAPCAMARARGGCRFAWAPRGAWPEGPDAQLCRELDPLK